MRHRFLTLTSPDFERRHDENAMLRAVWSYRRWLLAMGLVVELEEGATRTGNCRVTDVLPDLAGALVAIALAVAVVVTRRSSAQ